MEGHIRTQDETAHAMASELAELTGESLDQAVIEAVRLRLEQERRKQHDREQMLRKVKAITAEMRAHMGHPLPTSDHSWLYNERGLPK